MHDFHSRVNICIEGLEFISKNVLELINLIIKASKEFNKFTDDQKTKDFGELECDIIQQARMAVLAINTPEEFFNDLMKVGQKTVKTMHDSLDYFILEGESLCQEPEYSSFDSDLRSKLDSAIIIRNLFRKSK